MLFTIPAGTELRDTDQAPNFAVLMAGNTEHIHRQFNRFGSFALYRGAVGPYCRSRFDVPPEARPDIGRFIIPLDWFLDDDTFRRLLKSSALLFGPIFFAGIIFASSFRDSKNPDLDFGANIAGVVLGGAHEYLSLVFGFGLLPLIATLLYLLSWLGLKWSPRTNLAAPRRIPSLG